MVVTVHLIKSVLLKVVPAPAFLLVVLLQAPAVLHHLLPLELLAGLILLIPVLPVLVTVHLNKFVIMYQDKAAFVFPPPALPVVIVAMEY